MEWKEISKIIASLKWLSIFLSFHVLMKESKGRSISIIF